MYVLIKKLIAVYFSKSHDKCLKKLKEQRYKGGGKNKAR